MHRPGRAGEADWAHGARSVQVRYLERSTSSICSGLRIGLSADQEPSITNMIKLVELMKEEGIYTVLVDPVYNDRYGQVLQAELERKTGSEVTVLSIHLALGPYEDEAGRADYVDQLASNLVSLKAGLGVG